MLALLAGIGLDLLLKGGRLPRFFSFGVGSLAILLAAGALCLRPAASLTAAPENPRHKAMLTVRDTGENYGPEVDYDDPALVREAALYASNSLWLGAGTLATLAALLALSGFFRRATPALALLAATELLVFARQSLDTFVPAWDPLREVKDCLQAHPGGDYRILNLVNPNAAMTLPANDIWGLDPGVPRRYAEFLAFTQGQDPNKVTQDIPFSHYDPLYGMLRCRFSFMPRGAKLAIHEAANLLPRLELVSRFEVISRRDAIFAALTDTAFNPRQEVILETAPSPEPQPAANPGTVKLVDSSTDCLIIEAEVSSPSILLITDTYARGWRALPLKGSTQASYQVVPANYCLRAVPLAAGHHRLRLEYSPSGFRVGKWISAASALAYCGLLGWVLVLRWRSRRQDAGRV